MSTVSSTMVSAISNVERLLNECETLHDLMGEPLFHARTICQGLAYGEFGNIPEGEREIVFASTATAIAEYLKKAHADHLQLECKTPDIERALTLFKQVLSASHDAVEKPIPPGASSAIANIDMLLDTLNQQLDAMSEPLSISNALCKALIQGDFSDIPGGERVNVLWGLADSAHKCLETLEVLYNQMDSLLLSRHLMLSAVQSSLTGVGQTFFFSEPEAGTPTADQSAVNFGSQSNPS